MQNFPLHNFNLSRFVFQNARTPGTPGTPGTQEQEDQTAEQRERMETYREQQQLRSEVERAQVTPQTRQLMRECLASDSFERQSLVERLLRREINEDAFLEQLGVVEREEHSWGTIFATQRSVRLKIQELQYRAESYIELIPHQRNTFETLLGNVRRINTQDGRLESGLKRLLHPLTQANPQSGRGEVLSKDQANAIYMAGPSMNESEKILNKYKDRIQAAPGGRGIFQRLVAMKREEARIEQQFIREYNQFSNIIAHSMSKVRRKAEREQILKTASKAVGITIKEGTLIEYTEPDILLVTGTKKPVKIARIDWGDVTIRNHKGEAIGRGPGIPFIVLSNPGRAKMPIGRFKKWVDAVDATEVAQNVEDVERATGMAQYGIKLEQGMTLAYPRRKTDEHGRPCTEMTYVRVTGIKNGRIYFDTPVLFLPGFENVDEDMRDNLSFGEFVKWWHRYEVEKLISLEETRKLLVQFNDIENKQFGIEAVKNPPILLEPGEELKYPDEGGLKFRITGLEPDGVNLDNGKKYTFPEFFHWVANNHVEKVPTKPKDADEQEEEHKIEHAREEEIEHEEHEKEHAEVSGKEHLTRVEKDIRERAAGSITHRLKEIWWTTQLLSLKDLWNVVLEVVEFVKRKHGRRSKGRYGEVGSRLPWIVGTEFERVKQAAENEEVGKYKEAMEHWSIEKVKSTLNKTNSKDEAKACVQTLVHKGEMRWDDHHFWHTLNRLTSRYTLKGTSLYIPDPDKMPPGKSGEDMTIAAMDALWGEGTGAEWLMENTNKYNSNKNNFEYKFKQLENDPKGTGGPQGELQRLFLLWRSGGYVNAQEYEAMIDGAIKFGKMGAEDKIFYIMAGVLAHQGDHPDGETLMHMDRIGELDSKYLNQFPLLDYFTQVLVTDMSLWNKEEKKWGKQRKLNFEDLRKMMLKYFPDDFKKGKAGAQFSRWMWEVMLMEEEVRTRMSKGIRNAENMDHDDAHVNIPALTPTEVDQTTSGPSGQKKYFTNAGYANAYPGFNHYIVSLAHSYDDETDPDKKQTKVIAARDAVNSFIRFDLILDNRFLRDEGDKRARLDDRHYRRRTVVDDVELRLHQDQLRNLMMEIGKEYGENMDWLYQDKLGLDEEGRRKQKEYEQKVEELKERVNRMVEQDKGEKVFRVIKRARARDAKAKNGLRGIQRSKRPDPDKLALIRESAESKELATYRMGAHSAH